MSVNALKNSDQPEVAVVVEQVVRTTLSIDEPSAEEMALIDDAIKAGRARNKYYGSLGWLGKRKQWSHRALATVFDHEKGRSSVKYATRRMKYVGKFLNA